MKKIILGIIFILVLLTSCFEKKTAISTKIDYLNFKKQGLMQVIVIDEKNRNLTDLTILGKQMQKENKSSNIVQISIFDNLNAAKMLGDMSEWTKDQEEFYENHFIAQYNKNNNSRLNEYKIFLPNSEGGNKTIKY